jgi:hypothetical protein
MKLLMILGACIGFGIGVLFSWASESGWPSVLWRASATAYCAGLLMRWWGRMWVKGLREVLVERRLASIKAEEQQLAATSSK